MFFLSPLFSSKWRSYNSGRLECFPMTFSGVDQESEQSQKPQSWFLFNGKVSLSQEKWWHTPQVFCFSNSPSSGLKSPSLTRWCPWSKQGKQQMPTFSTTSSWRHTSLRHTNMCVFFPPTPSNLHVFSHKGRACKALPILVSNLWPWGMKTQNWSHSSSTSAVY